MPALKDKKIGGDGACFHIYNRGVEDRKLFNDKEDYTVFISYLKDYLTTPAETVKKSFTVKGRTYQGVPYQTKNYYNKIELVAYSLVPDHFHLLLNETSGGSIEKLIRSLCTRYVKYYNKKYQRHGALFAGPYKSIQIDEASVLLHLTRYIHLESLGDSKSKQRGYSSYDFYFTGSEASWIKAKTVLEFIGGMNDYRDFVEKYEPTLEEKEALDAVVLEKKPKDAQVIDPESVNTEYYEEARAAPITHKQRARLPVFIIFSVAVFLLLFSVSYRNVFISASESTSSIASLSPTAVPAVSGAKDENSEEVIEKEEVSKEEPEEVDEASDNNDVPATNEPRKVLMVVIGDGSKSVNIREKPTVDSEKIGEAFSGDHYEYVTHKQGWYEIILGDNSNGYLSARYIAEIKAEE